MWKNKLEECWKAFVLIAFVFPPPSLSQRPPRNSIHRFSDHECEAILRRVVGARSAANTSPAQDKRRRGEAPPSGQPPHEPGAWKSHGGDARTATTRRAGRRASRGKGLQPSDAEADVVDSYHEEQPPLERGPEEEVEEEGEEEGGRGGGFLEDSDVDVQDDDFITTEEEDEEVDDDEEEEEDVDEEQAQERLDNQAILEALKELARVKAVRGTEAAACASLSLLLQPVLWIALHSRRVDC